MHTSRSLHISPNSRPPKLAVGIYLYIYLSLNLLMSHSKLKLCETDVLYSEGGLRPYWRGKMHLVVAVVFLFASYFLMQKAETTTEFLSTTLFTVINTASYMISYCYHCIHWTPATEVRTPFTSSLCFALTLSLPFISLLLDLYGEV